MLRRRVNLPSLRYHKLIVWTIPNSLSKWTFYFIGCICEMYIFAAETQATTDTSTQVNMDSMPAAPVTSIIIAIDKGGTFTDIWATEPDQLDLVLNLLSVDPSNPHSQIYSTEAHEAYFNISENLRNKIQGRIKEQGILQFNIEFEHYLNMRYQGTETSMMVLASTDGDFKSEFLKRHLQEFDFNSPEDRSVLINDVRVRDIGRNWAGFWSTFQGKQVSQHYQFQRQSKCNKEGLLQRSWKPRYVCIYFGCFGSMYSH